MLVVDKVNLNYTTLTFSLFSVEENYMQVIMVNGYRSLMQVKRLKETVTSPGSALEELHPEVLREICVI